MGNYMDRHSSEPVVESDIPPLGHRWVCESPENDMQPFIENTTNKILEELSKVRGKVSNTSYLNFGCKERNDVAVGLNQIKSLDEKNAPYLEKDTRAHQGNIESDSTAVSFLNGILDIPPLGHTLVCESPESESDPTAVCFLNDILSYPEHRVECQKNFQEEEIIRLAKRRSRVRMINDEDDPLKASSNIERTLQGSSGPHSSHNLEGEEKMPCGVAYIMK
ncbi:uncharacterized protein LOC134685990 [Mytilus trossulus]|uniref:uncharacterized protein LOC134685990 n=1 Tax=Mytilus trossulus TaxID=6551 RepID=UPI003007EC73